MIRDADSELELWGGIECTVNRVGDQFVDQLEQSGHATRVTDLDQLADLGIRTLRYPLLWERIAPDGIERARWEWADHRLNGLRARGIDPIVGLLHHGSGPRTTSLTDPAFPERFASYAGAVAQRYPWVARYTPINEPLTTARFSALYGHWYPHARDDRVFARAVVNQLRAIGLAMRAIRAVNPVAQLVQTEDLGRTYSTSGLRYQAEFENERRWLTFDALCGVLDEQSTMWGFLEWSGIPRWELERLRDEPSMPDVFGINHYVTSERFLDDRMELYPQATHGGNGREKYADVEAVRVVENDNPGLHGALAESWRRYGGPLAVTETHISATREDQLRWLGEAWSTALELRLSGADIRAVTAWSLYGTYDWHALVTRMEGRYEPGAFDVRAPTPRATALATMTRGLARTGDFDHPVLSGQGWWRRRERLAYPAVRVDVDHSFAEPVQACKAPAARRILIVGATGTLGQAFTRICSSRGLACHATTRQQLDIADPRSIDSVLDEIQPWAIVNAAGYVRVDQAEVEREACFRDNWYGPIALARACALHRIPLLTFSSDLVFDGDKSRPYVESDVTRPLSVYGRSKAAAERAVREELPSALIVRTSAFFGPWDEHNYIAQAIRAIGAELPFLAPSDEVVSPTFVPDLVNASLDLLIDGECGIWHLANDGATTWAELARTAAIRAGLDPSLVSACPAHTLERAAHRPRYSALSSDRAMLMPSLDDAITRYFAARAACMQAA